MRYLPPYCRTYTCRCSFFYHPGHAFETSCYRTSSYCRLWRPSKRCCPVTTGGHYYIGIFYPFYIAFYSSQLHLVNIHGATMLQRGPCTFRRSRRMRRHLHICGPRKDVAVEHIQSGTKSNYTTS